MLRRTLFLAGLSCLASLGLASCASPGASTATTTASAPPSHCGYVTSEQGVPPQDQDIFEAFITQIDGRSTGTGMRHRLEAGVHTLTISEEIALNHLSAPELVQITQMKRREEARAYKKFEVDVQPGTTHRIGARLLRDKLDDASIDANAYWEPVVWETIPTTCR